MPGGIEICSQAVVEGASDQRRVAPALGEGRIDGEAELTVLLPRRYRQQSRAFLIRDGTFRPADPMERRWREPGGGGGFFFLIPERVEE